MNCFSLIMLGQVEFSFTNIVNYVDLKVAKYS